MSIGAVWACIALYVTLVPIIEIMQNRMQRVYSKRYREHKMAWISRRYPVLREMSWKEIEQTYDTEALYNRIR